MKGTPLTAWRVCCRRVIRSALTTSVDVGTHQIDSINDLNPLGRSHLRQWYGYYQGEVPEGGPFGERRWCGLDGPRTSRGHPLEVNPLCPAGRRIV